VCFVTGEQIERAHAAAAKLLPADSSVVLIVVRNRAKGGGSESTILAPSVKRPVLARVLRDCASSIERRPPDATLEPTQ
jgi:hypothetical protein